VLGYDSAELIGRSVFEFVHPDDRREVVETFVKGLENSEAPQIVVFRCLHKDGSWRTFESIGRNLLNDPEIRAAVINSRDVTERVQLEQQLLQSQKMEGIGRLAGGVAHDFNNLLTCIMGYGDLALDRISEEDRLHGQIKQIMQAANRASDLTRQLLAFARKQIVEPRNTNLNTLTLNLDKMLRRLIGEDIELVTFLSEDPAVVRIDPGQFEQVVINLAVNARDAMPHGGKLTIEIAQVSLDREYAKFHSDVKPGDYVMLAMSDTGIGMAEEVRARIFEPFFTTKEAGKGTGLGLATCYGIVRQAGGHIWVYSEPGKGTTFKIYLPRVEGAVTNNGSRYVALPAAGGDETILLVEDEPLVRSVTYQTLVERGYTIIEAHDGPAAIELAEKYKGPLDLLLTDVVLPQMSGRELSERLRRTRPKLRVLFMSGYTEDAIVHHGVLERGISFLPKPFTPEVLARKVRLVLDDNGDPATLQV
jgi:PAS domain S-box-containing protein